MNSRQDAMNSRTARIRANRRILFTGFALSVGLHGWAFAALTLSPTDLSRPATVPERVTMPSEYELSAIEVVEVIEVREEVEPLPLPTDDRPVLAAAAPERMQELEAANAEIGSQSAAETAGVGSRSAAEVAGMASQAAAADGGAGGAPASPSVQSPDGSAAAPESAPAPTFAELLESAIGNRPVVPVQGMLAAQRPLEGEAPIEAVVADPDAGRDDAEVEEGSIWGTVWRRMGKTFGFGGDKLCIPIPKAGAGSG